MQPKRQNSKKMQYQLLRKLPILGEINIKIKVCISLKRQLIVTFNIKAVRVQISKCSHPVKLSFGGDQKTAFYLSTEPWWSRCKKLRCKDFCLTFSMLPLSSLLQLFHLVLKRFVLPAYCLLHDLHLNR